MMSHNRKEADPVMNRVAPRVKLLMDGRYMMEPMMNSMLPVFMRRVRR